MFSQLGESARYPDYLVGASVREQQPVLATIYVGDIHRPWRSVYGFPMAAARLAAGETLVLSCREDEVFDRLAQINDLLESPGSLNQAYDLLVQHAQATQQKFERLLERCKQPLSNNDIPDVLAEIEKILTGPAEQTVADRLACILAPDEPALEIVGLGKMLARLRRVMVGLGEIKDDGFKVTVLDRQRQPLHPNLEAERHDPIPVEGQSSEIPVRFARPAQYHLTLWNYQLARRDAGQSVGWN